MDINELLEITVEKGASDLHLSTNMPPILRIDGKLTFLDRPALEPEILQVGLKGIMRDKQHNAYQTNLEIDFSYSLPNKTRFRVNTFHQQRGLGAAFRVIPSRPPTLEQMGLPESFKKFCNYNNGLVLVTGPTGSGKSTTLAAMINHINATQHKHIITVEYPIEFTHTCNKCLIHQRELRQDTISFNGALRSALREDPDIILIGEMRDLETIQLALRAAETGHLVFATLHTNSAAKTIDRIIDVFPAEEKDMIRSMLSESLRTVISQTLIEKVGGGRVAGLEVLLATHAVRNLIRENKVPQIYSTMQTSIGVGMQTLEQHLEKLIEQNIIDPNTSDHVKQLLSKNKLEVGV